MVTLLKYVSAKGFMYVDYIKLENMWIRSWERNSLHLTSKRMCGNRRGGTILPHKMKVWFPLLQVWSNRRIIWHHIFHILKIWANDGNVFESSNQAIVGRLGITNHTIWFFNSFSIIPLDYLYHVMFPFSLIKIILIQFYWLFLFINPLTFSPSKEKKN